MGTSNIKPVFDGAVNKGTEGEKPDPNAPPAEGDKKEEDPEEICLETFMHRWVQRLKNSIF